jgi:hypothetical protein
LAVDFFAVDFLAVVFLAGAFFAGAFFAVVVFLAGAFLAADVLDFFAAVDFVADFFAAVDFVAVFFAVDEVLDFLAGDFFAVEVLDFLAGDFLAVDVLLAFFAVVFAGVEDAVPDRLPAATPPATDATPRTVGGLGMLAAVRRGSFLAPEMMFFRSWPGVNFGTDFFLDFIRSPVCGLFTQRALRTAFSNEPKPVIATFSPLATSLVMVSSTDSSA